MRAKDIAKMLGVSTATVSLVVNNKPGVGSRKRREIIETIQELGCEELLKKGGAVKGKIIFVVFKKEGRIVDESPFFAYLIEDITQKIAASGYSLSFLYLNGGMEAEEVRHQLLAQNPSGLIIFGVEMKREDLQMFAETKLPFVIVDNAFLQSDVDSVAIANFVGTTQALSHLHEMGHREIGYLKCTTRINSFEERFECYRMWLSQTGLALREEHVVELGYSEREIGQAIRRLLTSKVSLPTAFFAENDYLGCHALRHFADAGIRIPQELSLVGFDDRPIAQMIRPQLTTVAVPKRDFGEAAVNLLLEKIEGGRTFSVKLAIGTNLVIRDSVKDLR